MKRVKRTAAIAAQVAMLAQAVLWIVFAVMRIIKISGSMDVVLALLMVANGIAFAVLGCLLKRRWLPLKILTVSFLLINLVLTVTDQMGVYDWLVLGLNVISLGGCLVLYSGKISNEDTT